MVWLFVAEAVVFPLKVKGHFQHQNRNTLLQIRLGLDGEYDLLVDGDCTHLVVLLQSMVQLKMNSLAQSISDQLSKLLRGQTIIFDPKNGPKIKKIPFIMKNLFIQPGKTCVDVDL